MSKHPLSTCPAKEEFYQYYISIIIIKIWHYCDLDIMTRIMGWTPLNAPTVRARSESLKVASPACVCVSVRWEPVLCWAECMDSPVPSKSQQPGAGETQRDVPLLKRLCVAVTLGPVCRVSRVTPPGPGPGESAINKFCLHGASWWPGDCPTHQRRNT